MPRKKKIKGTIEVHEPQVDTMEFSQEEMDRIDNEFADSTELLTLEEVFEASRNKQNETDSQHE
jgi:hypothetical protein